MKRAAEFGITILTLGVIFGGLAISGSSTPKAKAPERPRGPLPVGAKEGDAIELDRSLREGGYERVIWLSQVKASDARLSEFAAQMLNMGKAANLATGRGITAHMPEEPSIVGIVVRGATVERPRAEDRSKGLAVATWWRSGVVSIL